MTDERERHLARRAAEEADENSWTPIYTPEQVAAAEARKQAERERTECRGGTCRSILEQCSRHSWEYQMQHGRAANE
jgi:hypothetical protein